MISPIAETELFADAQALVLGAVTARRRNSVQDVHALLTSFMDEATGRGASREMCWAMLFSASTTWVDALVECRATHHQLPVRSVITELGMGLAASRG
jgi:hypothetical protein